MYGRPILLLFQLIPDHLYWKPSIVDHIHLSTCMKIAMIYKTHLVNIFPFSRWPYVYVWLGSLLVSHSCWSKSRDTMQLHYFTVLEIGSPKWLSLSYNQGLWLFLRGSKREFIVLPFPASRSCPRPLAYVPIPPSKTAVLSRVFHTTSLWTWLSCSSFHLRGLLRLHWTHWDNPV